MLGEKYKYGWSDPRMPKFARYEIVHRYGKWRVMDTHTKTILIKVNTKELAETYLRLLGEDDGSDRPS